MKLSDFEKLIQENIKLKEKINKDILKMKEEFIERLNKVKIK